jgi:hypothetical protein
VTPPRLPPSEQLREQPQPDKLAEEAGPDAAGASAVAHSGEDAHPSNADSAAHQLHPVLVTNAIWSLGVMGGPVAFEAEMDALVLVRPPVLHACIKQHVAAPLHMMCHCTPHSLRW